MIEAIVEDIGAKRELFAALDGICDERAVLATNTSAISVTAIAAGSAHPERCLGLHFFNPAPLMPLVEVVRAELTDDASYAAAYELIVACGKQAVRCNDTPGFVANRLIIPMLNDAVRALDEIGVEPSEIDLAMTNGAGWPMGPFRLIDLIGVDVHVHSAEALLRRRGRAAHGAAAAPAPDARRRPARAQDRPRVLRLRCGRVAPSGANGPELTESLPPQHRVMTAPVDNRVMRLPSHQHSRVSRAVALRAALGAVLTALVLVPAAGAAPGDRGVFVSKGVGPRDLRRRRPGVSYGTVFSGGSLVVVDYSATQDLKVDSPVLATINVDGSRTYRARRRRQEHGVPHLRLALPRDGDGLQHLNALGVYGRLQLRGTGTLTVNGKKSRWNGPAIKLGKVPKAVARPLPSSRSPATRAARAARAAARPPAADHDDHDPGS